MSLNLAPTKHNGNYNTVFNSSDYNSTASSSVLDGSLYLKNSGIVTSSALTTFSNSLDVLGKTTLSSVDVTSLLKAQKVSDSFVINSYSSVLSFSMDSGMVIYMDTNSSTNSSVSFTNIPVTAQQSYIFTFILKPSTVNSKWYIIPNSNVISVNSISSIPIFGIANVILPSTYTYLLQQITIINKSTTTTPDFIAFTNVSAY